jgi:hypothetical protein
MCCGSFDIAEQETKNKRIPVAEVLCSGREILDVLKGGSGIKFKVTNISGEQLSYILEKAEEKGLARAAFVIPIVPLSLLEV